MNSPGYRLYLSFLKLNLWVRQRLFHFYMRRRRSRLAGADLSYLYLGGLNLSDADLSQATFVQSDLTGINLAGAQLTGVDFSGASLMGADLSGAQLTGATISPVQLATVKSLKGAIMPDGRPYETWVVRRDDGSPIV